MKMNSLNKVLSLVILAIMMVSCGSAEDAKKHQDQQEIILKSHIISNRVQIDLAKNNGNDLKNLTVNDKLDFNLKSADQI